MYSHGVLNVMHYPALSSMPHYYSALFSYRTAVLSCIERFCALVDNLHGATVFCVRCTVGANNIQCSAYSWGKRYLISGLTTESSRIMQFADLIAV